MARGESDLNVVTTEPLKQTTGGVSTIKRGGGGSQEDVNKASSRNHSRSSTPGSIAPEASEKKETPRVMRPAYMVQAPPKQRRGSKDMLRRPSMFGGASPRTPTNNQRMSVLAHARMSVAPSKQPPPVRRKGKEPVGNYLLGDQLGRGQFGIVHRGVNSENGEFVAIKQMKSEKINEQALQLFESEIKLLENLHHENIVRYLTCIRTTQHLNLVIEYCDGGCLTDLLKKFGNFPERLCAVYIAQTLRGLEYLHSKQVIHRDIKGANILLTKSGSVKVADFGISMSGNSTEVIEPGVGSPYWMAPEVIMMEDTITVKADIWSLGSTVVELVSGKPPYSEFHPMGAIVRCAQDAHPPLPKNISPELESFLLRCFQKDVDQRASATELLEHPWFTAAKQSAGGDDPSAQEYVIGEAKKSVAPRSIRVYGNSIRSDSTFKTVFLTGSTTCTEVLAVVLKKYGVARQQWDSYAIFLERDSGEINMLDDNAFPLTITERWGDEQSHYQFSVRRRPPEGKRMEGVVLREETVRGIFGRRTRLVPRLLIVDSDEKYISFLETEDSSEYERPMHVIYDLRMVQEVLQVTNDAENEIFSFALVDRKVGKQIIHAESSEDLTAWICVIQQACGFAHDRNLPSAAATAAAAHAAISAAK